MGFIFGVDVSAGGVVLQEVTTVIFEGVCEVRGRAGFLQGERLSTPVLCPLTGQNFHVFPLLFYWRTLAMFGEIHCCNANLSYAGLSLERLRPMARAVLNYHALHCCPKP